MRFRAQSGPAGGGGLARHSQSLIVPVDGVHFPGAATKTPKLDFPRQHPGKGHLHRHSQAVTVSGTSPAPCRA